MLIYEPSPYLGPLVAPRARRIELDKFAFGDDAVCVKLRRLCLAWLPGQQLTMRLRRHEHKIICAEDAKKSREYRIWTSGVLDVSRIIRLAEFEWDIASGRLRLLVIA
jgi:hypothetical protein